MTDTAGDDVELRIVLHGTASIEDGATLSLRLFGRALVALSAAAQAVAAAVVASATDDPKYGSRGRLPQIAREFDVRIVSFKQGSQDLCLAMRSEEGPQLQLFEDFSERVSKQLVTFIVQESRGEQANVAVRRFIQALPSGVSSQTYEVRKRGEVIMTTTIAERSNPQPVRRPPRLDQFVGRIAAVGFEDGSSFVSVRVGSRMVRGMASREIVDAAVSLRDRDVSVVLLVATPTSRWVRISPAPFVPPSPEQRLKAILRDDAAILARLAK